MLNGKKKDAEASIWDVIISLMYDISEKNAKEAGNNGCLLKENWTCL